MNKIVSLAKRRGFIFPGSEIYGGLGGTWDYGPLGAKLKNNIRQEWWKMFVENRDDIFAIESAILMNSRVWEASGHLKNFTDPLIDCRACKMRWREDKIGQDPKCPNCDASDLTPARPFNMMFQTLVGPVEDAAGITYLRPETAQGMFVNFKNVLDSMRPKLPFGIAQIGKAFRNEITPGNFIFRTREFEQMEIEYFIKPDAWEASFEYWLGQIRLWLDRIGVKKGAHEREVPPESRAHYSRRTVDIDFDFPFGREELYGIAYRTDFDLKSHSEASGADLSYTDAETKAKFIPHVIEPTFGVERTVLAVLVASYKEEGGRVVLALPPNLAPIKVAVFPLLANKPQLVEKARQIYQALRSASRILHGSVAWDDRGNIGKRYWSQDEIGTPWCVTVDFKTIEDDTVTLRDRDTAKQERIKIAELTDFFKTRLQTE